MPTGGSTSQSAWNTTTKYIVTGSQYPSLHLKGNTQYWVVIWAGESTERAEVEFVVGTPTGSSGWTLANSMLTKPHGQAHTSWSTPAFNAPLKMQVEGTTNPEVLVSISGVTVTEGTHATADFVVSLDLLR